MLKYGLMGAVALTLVLVPAFAQERGGKAGPVTRADVEARVKDRFAKVDANRDGSVTPAEMRTHAQGKKAERRDKRFDMLDANNDGAVSKSEFDAPPVASEGNRKRGMRMMRAARGMWKTADANGDGQISLTEALVRPLERFDRADTNRDGVMTPEERKAARDQMRSEWRAKRG